MNPDPRCELVTLMSLSSLGRSPSGGRLSEAFPVDHVAAFRCHTVFDFVARQHAFAPTVIGSVKLRLVTTGTPSSFSAASTVVLMMTVGNDPATG